MVNGSILIILGVRRYGSPDIFLTSHRLFSNFNVHNALLLPLYTYNTYMYIVERRIIKIALCEYNLYYL